MNAPSSSFACEPTEAGVQVLMPDLTPITYADRLVILAAAPMRPRKAQRACDIGLFDLAARNQLELFNPPTPADE